MFGFIKQYLPRSLFGRSLMILVVPVVLIQIITAVVFFDRHWEKMTTRLAFAVSGEIAVVTDLARQTDELTVFEGLWRDYEGYLGLEISVLDAKELPQAQKLFVAEVWRNVVAQKLRSELAAQIKEEFVIDFDVEEKMISVFIALDDEILKIEFPQRRLFSSSGYVFLLWGIGVSILLLLVAVLFMRNQVRPIRKLAVAAERFGKGQDVPTFKPEGAKEVRQAAKAFLDMRRRIQRQISQRTDMLAGVSHDLRTPLTRLKLELEILSDKHDVSAMKDDLAQMEKMIAGYLDFVRGEGAEPFEFVDLPNVVGRLVKPIERHGTQVVVDLDDNLKLRVRPLAFDRALNNLMVNAEKYGKSIWIKAFWDDKKIQIQVEDDGPGIAEKHYDEVFKPFMRVDESRNTETGGVGLGMPIAKDIINAHGGSIALSKSAHGGLCVKVRMPT